MRRYVLRQVRSVRKRYVRWRYGNTPFVSRYLGADFLVRLENGPEAEVAFHSYERDRIEHFLRAASLVRPRAFLDVGANCGIYSCIMLRRGVVPTAFAFEPDSRNVAALRRNIELNRIAPACQVIEAAAGQTPCSAQLLHGPRENLGQSRIVPSGASDQTIDVVRIDDVVAIRGSAIAVKIDVEDFEVEALTGARATLSENVGLVQIETREHKAEVFRLMTDFGYRLVADYDPDFVFQSGPTDGPQR